MTEKQGLQRLAEALQTAEWDAGDSEALEHDLESAVRQNKNTEGIQTGQDEHKDDQSKGEMLGDVVVDAQSTPILAPASDHDVENEQDQDGVDALQHMLVRLQAARGAQFNEILA